VKKEKVRARIEEIGIIPAVRVYSAEEARFVAETVSLGGIPIVEITLTVPGAVGVISDLVRDHPEMIVGAGTVLDIEMAQRCLDAGAMFLTSTGLDVRVVELAVKADVLVLPGVLTPTEVMTAKRAGADLIKIYPIAQLGGDHYFRALKTPFPELSLVAAGGVNQQTAASYILAGAAALGIGRELIPKQAVRLRQQDWIIELARRFLGMVKSARNQKEGQ
jgi:2-dehydro-3-deoxyphosphogluconate aldolase/(4S)-4-hydroxy-2-oxoglutarate aldolase